MLSTKLRQTTALLGHCSRVSFSRRTSSSTRQQDATPVQQLTGHNGYLLGYHERADLVLGDPPKSRVPHFRTLSPEGQQLYQRLRSKTENPATILTDYINREQASTEVARLCVDEYRSRLFKHTRGYRLKLVRQDQIGSITLKWLWSQNMRWAATLQQDIPFIHTLVYNLVAEGLEKFVVGWIKAELPTDVSHMFTKTSVDRWRGQLLRALVGAHLDLDTRHSADEALRAYFQVSGEVSLARQALRQRVRPADGFAYTSFWPSRVRISSSLCMGASHATSPQLYDRFVRSLVEEGSKSSNESHAFRIALLHLHHPTSPNPDPALSHLRRYLGDRPWAEMRQPAYTSGASAKANVLMSLHRVGRQLQLQHARRADLDWVVQRSDQLLASADDATRKLFKFQLQQHAAQLRFDEGDAHGYRNLRSSNTPGRDSGLVRRVST